MRRIILLEMSAAMLLEVIVLTAVSFGQSGEPSPNKIQTQSKPDAAVPVTMTECEGINNCATWTFLGGQGNGQWPTGEIANLSVQSSDANTVVIRRADSTGAEAGLTAVYKGTRHDDHVGGEFTSSWPGHWESKSGNWYATVEKQLQSPTTDMHFCGGNCFTLHYENGRYVAGQGIWSFTRFTRESVILFRQEPDTPWAASIGWPGGKVVYKGHLSNDLDSMIIESENGGTKNIEKLKLAWGPALNTVPGSNEERERMQGSQPPPRPTVVVAPVVCVPWFFTVICGY